MNDAVTIRSRFGMKPVSFIWRMPCVDQPEARSRPRPGLEVVVVARGLERLEPAVDRAVGQVGWWCSTYLNQSRQSSSERNFRRVARSATWAARRGDSIPSFR
jgi:hypothetical protein